MDELEKLPYDQKISFMHAALILSKRLPVASVSANKKLQELLLTFGSIEEIFNHEFALAGVDTKIQSQLLKEYSRLDFSFKAISIHEDAYPDRLRATPNAAPIIYCRGDLSLLNIDKTIAFVGTRELDDPDHLAHSKEVLYRLSNSGYNAIVSGLALGSDTLGHRMAIELGLKTIAVLGTPLNKSYPKENSFLQETIALQHLLVSEYPIGIKPFGSFFANRNRTTVGLSTDGIVIARAGDKSGTLHAARVCIESNKTIYALENNIQDPGITWPIKYKSFTKIVRK